MQLDWVNQDYYNYSLYFSPGKRGCQLIVSFNR